MIKPRRETNGERRETAECFGGEGRASTEYFAGEGCRRAGRAEKAKQKRTCQGEINLWRPGDANIEARLGVKIRWMSRLFDLWALDTYISLVGSALRLLKFFLLFLWVCRPLESVG